MTVPFQISVRSVGTANASVISTLMHLDPSRKRIDWAERIYRAPSTLLRGLNHANAEEICGLLSSTGLEVSVEEEDQTPAERESPTDSYDVALVVSRVEAVRPVVEEVVGFLGTEVDEALRIVCNAPALLIGKVSTATVTAIRGRFAPLGVEIDTANTRDDRYDMVVAVSSATVATRVWEVIEARLGPQPGRRPTRTGAAVVAPIVIVGLPHTDAEALASSLQSLGTAARICSRSLQRLDLRLDDIERVEDRRGFAELVEDRFGVPGKIVPKLGENLPIILATDLRQEAAADHLLALESVGARATVIPLAFARYRIEIVVAGKPEDSSALLMALSGQSESTTRRALADGGTFPASFMRLGARWLKAELERVGTKVKVLE